MKRVNEVMLGLEIYRNHRRSLVEPELILNQSTRTSAHAYSSFKAPCSSVHNLYHSDLYIISENLTQKDEYVA